MPQNDDTMFDFKYISVKIRRCMFRGFENNA